MEQSSDNDVKCQKYDEMVWLETIKQYQNKELQIRFIKYTMNKIQYISKLIKNMEEIKLMNI